jgi:hypothetical protein
MRPDGTAKQQVGDQCQDDGDDQRLTWIEPAKFDPLVDRVDDDRQHEHLGDRLPAFMEKIPPMCGVAHDGP